jgi:hypothetical protein
MTPQKPRIEETGVSGGGLEPPRRHVLDKDGRGQAASTRITTNPTLASFYYRRVTQFEYLQIVLSLDPSPAVENSQDFFPGSR